MKAQGILAALEFIGAARVERRVPKTLLTRHGARTATPSARSTRDPRWCSSRSPPAIAGSFNKTSNPRCDARSSAPQIDAADRLHGPRMVKTFGRQSNDANQEP